MTTQNATSPDASAITGATSLLDLIGQIAGIPPDSQVQQTRHRRAAAVTATQACDELIFSPTLAAGLSVAERLRAAQAVAETSGTPLIAQHYAERQQALGNLGERVDEASPRLKAILHFARTIALKPLAADRAALGELQADGLTTPEIVMLAQLVGYVAFELRIIAGLQALQELGASNAELPTASSNATEAFVHPAKLPPPGTVLRINGYTNETLDWKAWLPVVDPQTATPKQQAVLDASHPKARTSDFYLLLAHQPEVLEQRSAAFNAIMYAPGGLPRAERELATAAVSRHNGCVYCLSVHAQRFEQLAKRNDVIAQLFADPDTAGTNPRERAIVQLALAITRTPGTLGASNLQPLRQAGLSDLEILDAIHSSALFAWANRLMLNLGEAVHPAANPS